MTNTRDTDNIGHMLLLVCIICWNVFILLVFVLFLVPIFACVSWFVHSILYSTRDHWGLPFQIRALRDVLDTIWCDKYCKWLVEGRWLLPSYFPLASTNKYLKPLNIAYRCLYSPLIRSHHIRCKQVIMILIQFMPVLKSVANKEISG